MKCGSRAHALARLTGGKDQGEKKKGLLVSPWLERGVCAWGVSGVAGDTGFKLKARKARSANFPACPSYNLSVNTAPDLIDEATLLWKSLIGLYSSARPYAHRKQH